MAEMVRRAVRAIPPGQVATYGDVAELIGCTARQVGRILATDGADIPWWRVVNASGRLPAHLLPDARRHWAGEGIDIEQDAALGQSCGSDRGARLSASAAPDRGQRTARSSQTKIRASFGPITPGIPCLP